MSSYFCIKCNKYTTLLCYMFRSDPSLRQNWMRECSWRVSPTGAPPDPGKAGSFGIMRVRSYGTETRTGHKQPRRSGSRRNSGAQTATSVTLASGGRIVRRYSALERPVPFDDGGKIRVGNVMLAKVPRPCRQNSAHKKS